MTSPQTLYLWLYFQIFVAAFANMSSLFLILLFVWKNKMLCILHLTKAVKLIHDILSFSSVYVILLFFEIFETGGCKAVKFLAVKVVIPRVSPYHERCSQMSQVQNWFQSRDSVSEQVTQLSTFIVCCFWCVTISRRRIHWWPSCLTIWSPSPSHPAAATSRSLY